MTPLGRVNSRVPQRRHMNRTFAIQGYLLP